MFNAESTKMDLPPDSRSATLAGEKQVGRSVSLTPSESLNQEKNPNVDDPTTEHEEDSFKDTPA